MYCWDSGTFYRTNRSRWFRHHQRTEGFFKVRRTDCFRLLLCVLVWFLKAFHTDASDKVSIGLIQPYEEGDIGTTYYFRRGKWSKTRHLVASVRGDGRRGLTPHWTRDCSPPIISHWSICLTDQHLRASLNSLLGYEVNCTTPAWSINGWGTTWFLLRSRVVTGETK